MDSARDGRNKDTQSSVVELTHMSDERPNTDSPGHGGGVSVGPKTRSQEVTERRWHVSTQRNLAGRPHTHTYINICWDRVSAAQQCACMHSTAGETARAASADIPPSHHLHARQSRLMELDRSYGIYMKGRGLEGACGHVMSEFKDGERQEDRHVSLSETLCVNMSHLGFM